MHQNEGTVNKCYEIVYIGREGYRYSCRICHVILTHQSYASLARYAARHLEAHALEWWAERKAKEGQQRASPQRSAEAGDRERRRRVAELLEEASRLNEGRGWLVKQLQDPDYRKLYIKYLVWVEHKRLSPRLLARLDPLIQHELVSLWNEEWKEFKRTWR